MEKLLLISAGAWIVGLVLSWFKLRAGYVLLTAGSTGYLGLYYYSKEEFATLFNAYLPEEGFEQADFAGTFAFLTYVMWISIGVSLLALLIRSGSKN